MVDAYRPRPHLIIIGGVHIAQPLQAFARQLGFRVSLVDPRGVFASKERFPDVDAILHSYPDKALPALRLDRNTYVAVLTHDPKIDDKALLTALPSAAAVYWRSEQPQDASGAHRTPAKSWAVA